MDVPLCCFDIKLPQQFLNISCVGSFFKKMSSKSVPKHMSADVFSDVPRFFGRLKDALYGACSKKAAGLVPLKQITFRPVLTSAKVGKQNIDTDLCLALYKQVRLPITLSFLF